MLWYVAERMLCQTVSELMAKVARENSCDNNDDGLVSVKCLILKQKLDALLTTLNEEAATTLTSTTVSCTRIEYDRHYIANANSCNLRHFDISILQCACITAVFRPNIYN